MKRQVNVWVRTDRVEARLERAALQRDAMRIARVTGIDPDALTRDAETLVARARAVGAVSQEQIDRFAATELGIDLDALRAETAQVAAMMVP